jgi:hypothetical protein
LSSAFRRWSTATKALSLVDLTAEHLLNKTKRTNFEPILLNY